MGLLVLPKKVAVISAPAPNPDLSAFADLIDRVGTLTEKAAAIAIKMKALKEELKPLAEAEKLLQLEIDALPIDDDAVDNVQLGEQFRLEVGRKGSSRSIKDMEQIKQMMGEELFMKLATVTLKAVDDYLTLPQKEQCLATSRGSRSFKIAKLPKAK